MQNETDQTQPTVDPYEPINPFKNLPASEQYSNLLCARHLLENNPDAVSADDKAAYLDFFFGLIESGMESRDIDIVEKVFPLAWKSYCAWNWDPPEVPQSEA